MVACFAWAALRLESAMARTAATPARSTSKAIDASAGSVPARFRDQFR